MVFLMFRRYTLTPLAVLLVLVMGLLLPLNRRRG